MQKEIRIEAYLYAVQGARRTTYRSRWRTTSAA